MATLFHAFSGVLTKVLLAYLMHPHVVKLTHKAYKKVSSKLFSKTLPEKFKTAKHDYSRPASACLSEAYAERVAR